MSDSVVLLYFPVLGRAQAIRDSLTDAGVDFDDLRVSLSDWSRHRDDPAFSGSYRALPTLSWGNVLVSEALPIASFVARRLGQYEGLTEEGITRREAICSSAYIDVLLRLADLIRADITYPGADPARAVTGMLPTILRKVELLDEQMAGGGWIGASAPVVADFFAAEAFEIVRYVLGPGRDPALSERFPRLAALALAVRERPCLARARESRPSRFTGRRDENRVIELLRAADLSSVGL
jgi:glutathione S-transferase